MDRVMITGSRGWTDYGQLHEVIVGLPRWYVLIHGGAAGADRMADAAARLRGLQIEVWLADWNQHKNRAGTIRNDAMLDSGVTLVLAFWDGESRGTKHAIDGALKRRIPLHVFFPRKEVQG